MLTSFVSLSVKYRYGICQVSKKYRKRAYNSTWHLAAATFVNRPEKALQES